MIPFSLRQLGHVVAAARHENVTAAARALHVSQPSISASIARIENHYGRPLFVRHTGQGVSLTPFGRQFVREATALVASARNLADLDRDDCGVAGELIVGCYEGIAPIYLPRLMQAFRARHPGVTLHFREAAFDGLSRLLEQGSVDLALGYQAALNGQYARTVLLERQPYAMMPEDHPLTALRRLRLRDIAAHPLVFSGQPTTWTNSHQLFRSQGLEPMVAMRARSFELQRALVARGFGVGIATTKPISDKTYDGARLIYREIDEVLPRQAIVAAYDQAGLTRTGQAFIDTAVACLTETPRSKT
ncbi:MAG: LysR substrate-binding domain-containing protein [Ferrovibrionaceae bacterium]